MDAKFIKGLHKKFLITDAKWDNISGLNLYLTYSFKSREKDYEVYGPEGVKQLMSPTMTYYHEAMFEKVKYFECKNEQLKFSDKFIVQTIPVYMRGGTSSDKYVLIYIVKPNLQKPRLSPALLVQHGVPPGPLVEQLKNGESITLPNGEIVTPGQVNPEGNSNGEIVVVDIPSISYLDSLMSCDQFSSFFSPQTTAEEMCCGQEAPDTQNIKLQHSPPGTGDVIVHLSPDSVLRDTRYQEWSKKWFGIHTKHLILNKSNPFNGLNSSTEVQIQLNWFLPSVFPIFKELHLENLQTYEGLKGDWLNNAEERIKIATEQARNHLETAPLLAAPQSRSISTMNEFGFSGPTFRGLPASIFYIKPKVDYCTFREELSPKKSIAMMTNNLEVLTAYEKFIKQMRELRSQNVGNDRPYHSDAPTDGVYPKVVTLGTGSCTTSIYRNNSSVLIMADVTSNYLFDCGIGTYFQLARLFGLAGCDDVLTKLKFIFVSHVHDDHVWGILTILKIRMAALKKMGVTTYPRLHLFMPPTVYQYIMLTKQRHLTVFKNVILMQNMDLLKHDHVVCQISNELLTDFGLRQITTVAVPHVAHSYGISVVHVDGWKITYSGDTMPSHFLVKMGMNSDILIHEATFEDSLENDAKMKRHSTVGQAIRVGRAMRARRVILTHFSQRYPRFPILPENMPANVIPAFDNMVMSFDLFGVMRAMCPVFCEMFQDSLYQQRSIHLRKAHRKERENRNL